MGRGKMENKEWEVDGELNACYTKLVNNENLRIREKMLLQKYLEEMDYKNIEKYRKVITVRDKITELLKNQIRIMQL